MAGFIFGNTKEFYCGVPGKESEEEVSIDGFTSFRKFKLEALHWCSQQDLFLVILRVSNVRYPGRAQLAGSIYDNTKGSTMNLPGREPEGEVSIYNFTSFRKFKLGTISQLLVSFFGITKSSTVDLPGRESEGEVSSYRFTTCREFMLEAVAQLAGSIFSNT